MFNESLIIYERIKMLGNKSGNSNFVLLIKSNPMKEWLIFSPDTIIIERLGYTYKKLTRNNISYISINLGQINNLILKLKSHDISYVQVTNQELDKYKVVDKFSAANNQYEKLLNPNESRFRNDYKNGYLDNVMNSHNIASYNKPNERSEDKIKRIRGDQSLSKDDSLEKEIKARKHLEKRRKKEHPSDKPTWEDMRKLRKRDLYE